MLKAYLQTVSAVDCSFAVLSHGRLSHGVRSVSTNSAIARGIRRSKPPSYKSQYAQSGGKPEKSAFRKRHDEESPSRFGRENTEGIRRPNHQQKQDVEDMEQLSLQKKDRLSPRQKRYLQGGRTNGEPTKYGGRDASGSSMLKSFEYRRGDRRDRDPDTERRRTPELSDAKHRSGRASPSYRHEWTENGDRYSGRNDESYRPSMQSKDRSERSERYASREKPRYRTHVSDNKEASFDLRDRVSSGRADSAYNSRDNSDRRDASSSYQSYRSPRRSSAPESSKYGDSSDKPKNRKELRALKFGPASSQDSNPTSQPQSSADYYKTPQAYSPEQYDSDITPQQPESPTFELPKDGPLSIPYTTPASEFLYGTSVVLAALTSPLRKLYKLYLYSGTHREAAATDARVHKLALARNVPLVRAKHDLLRLMDKMSSGRPHNGYILEASPLPKLPAASLLPVPHTNAPLALALDHQSREDAAINGTDPHIPYRSSFPRHPLLVFLDGILDPGNLGAILRSAHFLGVDAVTLSARHSAPLTPVALKASAGAAESLPLISIRTPAAFVDASRAAGWKFYAAVAPTDQVGASADSSGLEKENTAPPVPHYDLPALAALCPTRKHPCVLMLGGEGEGLRWALRRKADASVSIGASWRAGGVDSLNVSVAAGLLCEAFLRAPVGVGAQKVRGQSKESGSNVEVVGAAEVQERRAEHALF